MTNLDLPWWFVALVCLMVVVLYFGIGATLGFLCTYVALRPLTRPDNEQEHPRSRALGASFLGALAGGATNLLVAWIFTHA
ncbi:hypothetical protein GBA65_12080 [Rubrobacter marinus]|uniref:Uncharacterized protein n=1 Tax=Rubrobacter marinus TaxID=2653852 RepID=A0A6G8PY56_9ACTN|nr:hypothetical protein [Rubrobacter marinus]QIN79141.1 hypothetical protein GBA65_12080 [Rubrobacter marinus]